MPDTKINPTFYIRKLNIIKNELKAKKKHASLSSTEDMQELSTIINKFTKIRLELNNPDQSSALKSEKQAELNEICTLTLSYIKNIITQQITHLKQIDTNLITSINRVGAIQEKIDNIQVLFGKWKSLTEACKIEDINEKQSIIHGDYIDAVSELQAADWSKPLYHCIQENVQVLQGQLSQSSFKENLVQINNACTALLEKVKVINKITDQTSPKTLFATTLQTINESILAFQSMLEPILKKDRNSTQNESMRFFQLAKKKPENRKNNPLSLQHQLFLKDIKKQISAIYLQVLQECEQSLADTSLTPRP